MWPLTGKEIYEAIQEFSETPKSFLELTYWGASIDSRKIDPPQIFVAFKGEQFDGHAYLQECFQKGITLALVEKNSLYLETLPQENSAKCIPVKNSVEAFRKLAAFMRSRFTFPVIAVGGSNGKTTTKEMLASLLSGKENRVCKTEKSENGYLGLAITLCQKELNFVSPPDCLILEIGIDEIGAMQSHVELGKPEVALLTALEPEHLELLKNWETAAKEELVLFESQKIRRIWQLADSKLVEHFWDRIHSERSDLQLSAATLKQDFAVLRKDFCVQKGAQKYSPHELLSFFENVVTWSIVAEQETTSQIELEILRPNSNFLDKSSVFYTIPFLGEHNAANFALAFATGVLLGRSNSEMQNGWSKFVPPLMRSRLSILKGGVTLIDDSYNASPKSVEVALQLLGKKEWQTKKKLVVLGDMLDLGSESNYWHEKIVPQLQDLEQIHLCLYGKAMYNCYRLLKQIIPPAPKNAPVLFWLSADEHPRKFLEMVPPDLRDWVVLVKGSRGMKLERFVSVLAELYGGR